MRPQHELTRLAAVDGQVVADRGGKLPGRGAYVCDRTCLAAATQRRAFGRAFRRAVEITPNALDSENSG